MHVADGEPKRCMGALSHQIFLANGDGEGEVALWVLCLHIESL